MRKLSKIMAIVCICAMMAALFGGCQVVNTICLATVNGEEITKADFDYYFYVIKQSMLSEAGVAADGAEAFWKDTEIDGKNAGDVAKERALDEAVKMAVQVQKAKEMGITIDAEG